MTTSNESCHYVAGRGGQKRWQCAHLQMEGTAEDFFRYRVAHPERSLPRWKVHLCTRFTCSDVRDYGAPERVYLTLAGKLRMWPS